MVKQNVKATNTGNANAGASLPKSTAPVQVVTGTNPKNTAGLTVQDNNKNPGLYAPVNDNGVQGEMYNGRKPNLPAELPVQPPVNRGEAVSDMGSSANTGGNVKENLPTLPSINDIFTPVEDTERNQTSNSNNGSSANTGSNVKDNLPTLPSDGNKYTPVEATSPSVAPSTSYDPNVDYQALINEAVANGDYVSAAKYEQLRNQKIRDMNAAGANKWNAEETNLYSGYLADNAGSSTNTGGNVKENLPTLPSNDNKYTPVEGIEPNLGNNTNPGGTATTPVERPATKPTLPSNDNKYTPVEDTERNPSNSSSSSANTGSNVKENLPTLPSNDNKYTPVEGLEPNLGNNTNPGGAATTPVEQPSTKPSTKPSTNPSTNPVTKPSTNPVTNPENGTTGSTTPEQSSGNLGGNTSQGSQDTSGGITESATDTSTENKYDEEYIQSLIESIIGQPSDTAGNDKYGADYIQSLIGSLGGQTSGTAGNDKYGADYIQSLIESLGGQAGGTTTPGSVGADNLLDGVLGQILDKYNNGSGANLDVDIGDLYSNSSTDPLSQLSTEQLKAMLNESKAAAEQQTSGQIDYATQQAVKELERAMQDAQPQFKEQSESVDLSERQAMDNAALYAELRGDRGGIGAEQYNSIQNAAAQNRLAVQQAQTKLSTDTARQIEDLRAQGEFEKADKALEITQDYLSKLMSLEQWAQEYNMSVDQFNAQLGQWEKEYNMALKQLEISNSQWEQEFGFSQDQFAADLDQWMKEYQFSKDQAELANSQWEQEFNAALQQWANEFAADQSRNETANSQWEKEFNAALQQWANEFAADQSKNETENSQWEKEFNAALQQWANEFAFNQSKNETSTKSAEKEQLANIGWAMLEMGVVPDTKYLEALGMDGATAQKMVDAVKASKGSGVDTSTGAGIYDALRSAGATDYGTAYALLRGANYSATDADRYAKYFSDTWLSANPEIGSSPKFNEAVSMAQGMTREEADEYLGYLVANGSLTKEDAIYIYDNLLNFLTVDKSSDKFQPVQLT